MERIIGIDLGTTNTLVSVLDAGVPMVLADSSGRRLIPSVVHYSDSSPSPIVGVEAERARVAQSASTFYQTKRFIGRRFDELSDYERSMAYAVAPGPRGVSFPFGDQLTDPESVAAALLAKARAVAEDALEERLTKAVITVPAYFNDAQRNATKRAGELAGLEVVRIINEPTAAALAYGVDKRMTGGVIAVYDFGGGTFDISILRLKEGVFEVMSTCGDTGLGGGDIDRALYESVVSELETLGCDVRAMDMGAQSRVLAEVESAKKRLSEADEVSIDLPFLEGTRSFSVVVTRERLNGLARPVIERTRARCMRALEDAKIDSDKLDRVLLVGGQTRMPWLREWVGSLFGCREFEAARGGLAIGAGLHESSPELDTSQNPDEAIALGAAIQAGILSGAVKDLLLLDVTPLSLGIETFGGLMNVIIPRNSTIPIKAGEMFTTAVDGQREMVIRALQGERERAKDNWTLGEFTLEFESLPRGQARVGVQFEIDANGILHVLARDVRTGHERVVEIESAVDVDDFQVQEMIESSVDHAFSDLRLRQWVEAEQKAVAALDAAEEGLRGFRDQFSEEDIQEIESALEGLRVALDTRDDSEVSGDLERLKLAARRVDEVTASLAELMMDAAMVDMLRAQGLID